MRDFETLHFPISISEVRVGWEVVLIRDIVADIQTGFASGQHNSDGIGIPHLRPMNISADGKIDLSDLRFIDPANNPLRLRHGDVLFNNTNSPAWVGKTALVDIDQELAFSNHMTRLRMQGEIDPRFTARQLHFVCRAGYFEHQCKKHVNQASINRDFLVDQMPFLLPPLAEQRRIANKLDAVLTRVDGCRERLDRVPAILKRFRQSVLAAATSGRLTTEWRIIRNNGDTTSKDIQVRIEEPYAHKVTAPASWNRSTLGECCEFIGGSQPPKSTFVHKDGPGLIRLIQIRDYKSDKHITFIPEALAKRFCTSTDVMIGRYGPPLFQILRGLEGAYNVALMKAQPKVPSLDLEYLYVFLRGDNLLKYVEAASDRTAGQDGVRKELLTPYPMFLPTLDEQSEIVRRVEILFAFADRLETRYKGVRQTVERLTPAILGKAFRGELTPQGPSDEPASELLRRIQAARSANPVKPNRRSKVGRVKSKLKAETNMLNRQLIRSNHLAAILAEKGSLTSEALWSASQLDIDDFYDQLKSEEEAGFLKERRDDATGEVRLLEAA
jgi:type I restriction enzyme S subunit